jgi:hypothetical protein
MIYKPLEVASWHLGVLLNYWWALAHPIYVIISYLVFWSPRESHDGNLEFRWGQRLWARTFSLGRNLSRSGTYHIWITDGHLSLTITALTSWDSVECNQVCFQFNGVLKSKFSFHTCRQVDSAAPRPVPVHNRIPLLYSVDVFDTPANWKGLSLTCTRIQTGSVTYLHLPCPDMCGRIIHKTSGEVALNTTYQIMILRIYTFTESI